jgi:hypothetical protein
MEDEICVHFSHPMLELQKAVDGEAEANPAKREEADNLENFVHF